MSSEPRRRRPYAPRVPPDVRREQVLDAAFRVISRDGYGAVTIEAIARECGVTKPVVYGVFDSLGPLLAALLERETGRALVALFASLPMDDTDAPAEEFVASSMRAWIEVILADAETWSLVLVRRQNIPPVVWDAIEHGRELVRGVVVELIRQRFGPAEGVDADILSMALLAMAEDFGRRLLLDADDVDVEKLVSTMQVLMAAASR
ncbi:MAG TPA: helix-turn-helix domain-containing protein [Nocardioidaceae bacterium]|nr:helix-turn-helix domain-containing protein [Nocardioidaceae bacterium]